MQLEIKRNTNQVAIVEIDENTVFTHKLMGEHKVKADFIASSALPIQIGDYIEHRSERFYINTPPEVEKINNFTYRYLIEFEGEIYKLYNKIFMDEGVADFSYHGTPEDFLLLILTNINTIDAGWQIADVDELPAQTLIFSGDSCRTALTKIAEAFDLEFRLVQRNIYLEKSVGADTTLQFAYGRGKGLYHLNRNKIDDTNVVTRVYGFGSQKNISYKYRDGLPRLVFDERFLQANTDLYGIREGSINFDDIFPNRTGTITGIDNEDKLLFRDLSIDFDINDHLLEGTTAKVVFKSGELAGYEFEIERYRNNIKEIKLIPFEEQNDYVLPNDLNFPEVGDEYTLVDIRMPDIYIVEAEADLKKETQRYLEENSVPRVTYTLEVDEKYIRERGIDLRVANLVRVIDEALGINNKIRVAELSYPLVNTDKVTATIADTIPYTIQEKNIADTIDNNTHIENVDRKNTELARRSALRFRKLQELMFDPDGYFDPESIKPGSIETLMLSVGARSQNFGLIGVTIEANAENNPNTLKISAGQLAHYQIEIEELGYVWEMDPNIFTDLDPEKPYYVYAKCSATALTGVWEVSENPKMVDDEEGHYLFNLGILYPVKDGRRDFDFTNGMTYINGDTITTGTIKSLDGLNYFDLAGGKFKIGNEESSLDYNVTEQGRLTLKGVLVSSLVLADAAAIENLTVRNLRTRDEGRRLEILESKNNLTLYDQQGREVTRIDDDIDSDQSTGDPLGGIRSTNPVNRRVSFQSGNGIFSNGSNVPFFSATTGIQTNASIVGMLFQSQGDISAGVAGINYSNSGWAGYFNGGVRIEGGKGGLDLRSGLHLKPLRITSNRNQSLDDNSVYVACYNTAEIEIRLPYNAKEGRIIYVRRINDRVIVRGSGYNMVRAEVENNVLINRGDLWQFYWDGGYWLCNYQGRSS